VQIPVVANGNILTMADVTRCAQVTGADAVMSAEGVLYNPALFSNTYPPQHEVARRYLDMVRRYAPKTKIGYIRGHLFKIFRPSLSVHTDLRAKLGTANGLDAYDTVVAELAARLEADMAAAVTNHTWPQYPIEDAQAPGGLRFPHWVCQPYVRVLNTAAVTTAQAEAAIASGIPTDVKRRANSMRIGDDQRVDDDDSTTTTMVNMTRKKPRKHALVCGYEGCTNVASEQCTARVCRRCCRAAGKQAVCAVHQGKARQKQTVAITPTPVITSASA